MGQGQFDSLIVRFLSPEYPIGVVNRRPKVGAGETAVSFGCASSPVRGGSA